MEPEADAQTGLAAIARRVDPDRYFCALFASASARPALFTLIAFNHELARAREVVREPAMALIRLQWWHEVVEGAARAHEVAGPLRALVAGGLPAAPLLSMIEVREAQVEGPPETLAVFLEQMAAGPGALAVAMAQALGAPDAALPRVRDLGAAYGVMGSLRAVGVLAAQQRCLLPRDVLAAGGLSPEDAVADPAAALRVAGPALRVPAASLLGRPARLPRSAVPAGLVGVLARRDLARDAPRGLADRLAVTAAALSGLV